MHQVCQHAITKIMDINSNGYYDMSLILYFCGPPVLEKSRNPFRNISK